MAMTPQEELADKIIKRLHDPDAYTERQVNGNKREPLKTQQARAIMTIFEDVQRRERDGQVTVLARTAWRDKNPDIDG